MGVGKGDKTFHTYNYRLKPSKYGPAVKIIEPIPPEELKLREERKAKYDSLSEEEKEKLRNPPISRAQQNENLKNALKQVYGKR
jgi:hypothetical protein